MKIDDMNGSLGSLRFADDTLRQLLALPITSADEQDQAKLAALAEHVQAVTGETVELVYLNQGYSGETATEAAEAHGMRLEADKLQEAK